VIELLNSCCDVTLLIHYNLNIQQSSLDPYKQ